MSIVKLVRGAAGPDALREALDSLGVKLGEEFMVAKVEVNPRFEDPTANVVGGHSPGSETSRQAALDNAPRSGSQRDTVLRAIARAGEHGMTRDELATTCDLRDSSADGRVWDLLRGHFIEETGRTRATSSGSSAGVLVLTDKGRAWAAGHGEAAPAPPPPATALFGDSEIVMGQGRNAINDDFD